MLMLFFDWIRSSGSNRVFFPTAWFDIGSECIVLQVNKLVGEMRRMKECWVLLLLS